MDVTRLAAMWPVSAPWVLSSLSGGMNNTVYAVVTPSTERYILRVYRSDAALPHIHYEHAVITALQTVALPFAVPAPVYTNTGATLAHVSDGVGNAFATLTPFVASTGVSPDDSAQAAALGRTLAQLTHALASVTVETNTNCQPYAPYARLASTHPRVLDPLVAIARLALPHGERKRLIAILERLDDSVSRLATHLPRQIMHRDYNFTNVLMRGDTVVAVLDFEFAGPDMRAMDFAEKLAWHLIDFFGAGTEWGGMEAFGHSYAALLRHTDAEIAALPTLCMLRSVSALIYTIGRHSADGVSPEPVYQSVRRVLQMEDRLIARANELCERVHGWYYAADLN